METRERKRENEIENDRKRRRAKARARGTERERERGESRVLIVSHGGGATADRLAGLPSMRARRESRGKGLKERTAREKRKTTRAVLRLGKDSFVSTCDAWTGDGEKVEVDVRDHRPE